jgi:HlyD family secretion protein
VSFTVDAFPDRQFRGQVQQVRLAATTSNNVVTYPVVVAVDNSDRSLLPGMTANAEIEVSRRDNVLRVPNSALRFKPADDAADAQAPQQDTRGGGMGEALPKLAQSLQLDASQQAAFDAALSAMKQRAESRRAKPPAAAPGAGASLFGGRGGQQRRGGGGDSTNQGAMRQRMLERMTQQFAAFRSALSPAQQQQWDSAIAGLASARRAPLYLLVAGKPKQVMVRIGASDGSNTEVSGDIHAGDLVIVGAERATPAQ